jgi:hypothetical protein
VLWPTVRTYPVRAIGLAAAAAVGLTVLAYAAVSLSPLIGRALAERAASAGDTDQLLYAAIVETVLGLAHLAVFLTAIVLVIIWFYRARKNLDAFPGAGPTMSNGWAIAGWLVPFANFVVPCRVMANIARDSLWRTRTPPLVGIWWSAWLVYLVSERYVSRTDGRAYAALPEPRTQVAFQPYVDYYAHAVAANLVPLTAAVIAGALLIVLIRMISAAQEGRIARGLPVAPVMPGMTVASPVVPGAGGGTIGA